jgi:amino acid transporter
MCQACFAYTGTEVVGMTFGETPNPRKNIPRAVTHTFWRIAGFYVTGVLVLGMTVPYDNDRLLSATGKATSAGEFCRHIRSTVRRALTRGYSR